MTLACPNCANQIEIRRDISSLVCEKCGSSLNTDNPWQPNRLQFTGNKFMVEDKGAYKVTDPGMHGESTLEVVGSLEVMIPDTSEVRVEYYIHFKDGRRSFLIDDSMGLRLLTIEDETSLLSFRNKVGRKIRGPDEKIVITGKYEWIVSNMRGAFPVRYDPNIRWQVVDGRGVRTGKQYRYLNTGVDSHGKATMEGGPISVSAGPDGIVLS